MTKKTEPKCIYIASLYRFGYDLTVAAESERDAVNALMSDYDEAFERYNGCEPSEIAYDRGETEKTYHDLAKEEIEIRSYEIGKVEWC